MVRAPIAIGITFALQAACGYSGGYPPDAGPHVIADAPPPPWWAPRTGDAKNWDIQLGAPIDLSAQRTMYVLDLWSLVPSPTTIDYGDGDPVSVPAGSRATAIADLHAMSTIVVCRIDTGALELDRPDARKFPGATGLTTCPTTVGATDAIGMEATAPNECYLNLNAASTATWSAIMFKRFDLAKQIGCDAIVGDRNDSIAATTAYFNVPVLDQQAWYQAVADQTHARTLSAGMKDGYEISSFPDMLAPVFDWLVVQDCGAFGDCDRTRPFYDLQKEVLAIDYPPDPSTGITTQTLCNEQHKGLIASGLIKDEALSSALRTPCTP